MSDPQRPTVIRAGRLIDCASNDVRTNMAVTIRGTKIAAVEPWRDELASGATVLDHSKQTVMPGLVDAHCHLSLLGRGWTYEEEVRNSNEFMAVTAVYNAQQMLASGVTTLRDNGCRDSIMFEVRKAFDMGMFVGPRMLISGRPVTITGGHFDWCNGVADGVESIRVAIRQLVREGADHIKIMASGGGTAGTNPGLGSYTVPELAFAVHLSHSYGRLTTAHCRSATSVERAVEANIDCIEHAEYLRAGDLHPHLADRPPHIADWDPEAAQHLADSKTFASLTFPGSSYTEYRRLRDMDGKKSAAEQARYDHLRRGVEGRAEMVRKYLALGMLPKLVISSDAGPFDIEFAKLWQGLEIGVTGGMTTMQALQAATRTASLACGILDKVGTLEAGKEADVLVLNADPLADVANLQAVAAVYKAGQLVHLP